MSVPIDPVGVLNPSNLHYSISLSSLVKEEPSFVPALALKAVSCVSASTNAIFESVTVKRYLVEVRIPSDSIAVSIDLILIAEKEVQVFR